MRDLKTAFEDIFQLPFSVLPRPDGRIVRIFENLPLYGTPIAKEGAVLIQRDVARFADAEHPGYFMIGFWGHGINSYAFYYVRDDGRSRICLRLAYGGVYMDNATNAYLIHRFLPAFFAFESEQIRMGATLLAIDSMGRGQYQLTRRDGSLREYDATLFGNEKFQRDLDFNAFLR